MDDERTEIQRLMAETDFTGVVALHQPGREPLVLASGLADRAQGRPVTATTRFGIASGTKGFTAVTIASLVEDGALTLDTTVADILGGDLPNVDPGVTVEHLLAHRSGIGDYLDESLPWHDDDHTVDVPVHTLQVPSDYLPLLVRHPQVFAPGTDFAYNNSGYVVLSLLVERLAPEGFHQAVRERVFRPAGMADSDFFRSDDPPPDLATGYLTDGRTNLFHLPVIGAGDGGAHCTGPDVLAFWAALLDGRLVSPAMVDRLTTVRSTPSDDPAYGMGFWLEHDGDEVVLIGGDAGVSFRSGVSRTTGRSWALLANTSAGAWPVARFLGHRPQADHRA